MARRPFISKGIDELELMFKTSGSDLLTLTSLEEELIHRSTPRAVHLLKTVRKALALPQFANSVAKPRLFDSPPIDRSAAAPLRAKLPEPVPTPRAPELPHPVPVTQRVPAPYRVTPLDEPIPFPPTQPNNRSVDAIMSADEACKVLEVTLGANWESIEESRREIVQKSHPDRVRSLPPEKRRALIERARRANHAIQVLLALKVHENSSGPHRPDAIKPVSTGIQVPIL